MQYWSQGFAAVSPGPGYYGETPIQQRAPPSTYAVAAVLEGERGALPRLVGVTTIRAVFIIPGIWLGNKLTSGGLPLWRVLIVSLCASTTISLGMLAWYGLKRGAGAAIPPLPAMSGRR